MHKLKILYRRIALVLLMAALSSPSFAEVINVDSATLQQLIDQGVSIVDVRRTDEWQETGVIEKSHLLTFFDSQGQYDAEKWLSELDAIVGPDEPVVLICHSGARSKLISQWLSEKQGYSKVYNVTHGIAAWVQSGGLRQPRGAEILE